MRAVIRRPDIRLDVLATKIGDSVYYVQLTGEAQEHSELSFASMRAHVRVNCHHRRERVENMVVFPRALQRGQGRTLKVHGEWTDPSPDAYLAEVIRRVCGARRAQQLPLPTPALSSETGPGRPTALLLTSQTARVAPPLSPSAAQKSARFAVQITAAASEASAWRLLNSVKSRAPRDVRPAVKPAKVHGRLYYRGALEGFDSRARALEFCATWRATGRDCIVKLGN